MRLLLLHSIHRLGRRNLVLLLVLAFSVGCGGSSKPVENLEDGQLKQLDKNKRGKNSKWRKKNGKKLKNRGGSEDKDHPEHDHWHPHPHEPGVHHHHPHPHPHLDGPSKHHHAY